MVESTTKPRLALIGSTGAIGREICQLIRNDARFSEVILFCRNPLPEWTQGPQWVPKMTLVQQANYDEWSGETRELLQGCDAFLCCLGTRVKEGAVVFDRIDRHYPVEFAKLALSSGAKHYGLLTS